MWPKRKTFGRNKYRAQRTEYNGYSFASKLEASVYGLLLLMERAEEITDIKVQQHVYLTKARIQYIVDFSAVEKKSGLTVYIEAKGLATPVFQIKKRLWHYYGPGILDIYGGSYQKPFLMERIIPMGGRK